MLLFAMLPRAMFFALPPRCFDAMPAERAAAIL